VIIVLLNVALIWAIALAVFRRTFRLPFAMRCPFPRRADLGSCG
jgi:hypothetical protein